MFTVIQYFRTPEWTGQIEDHFETESEALTAYDDAAEAYAYAPSGPSRVTLRAHDGTVVRQWPRS